MVDKLFSKLLSDKINSLRKPTGFKTPSWLLSFIDNFDTIKVEFENYKRNCNSGELIDEISNEQKDLNKDKKWKVIFLYGYSYFNEKQREHFPTTLSIISEHRREINLVMFSTTESGKHIPTHKGNNLGVLRVQIGISIIDPDNCILKVEDTIVKIKEKELFIFDDTFDHELVNNSEFDRTVLIIDFYKPLPFFYNLLNKMENRKIAKSKYVKEVLKNLKRK